MTWYLDIDNPAVCDDEKSLESLRLVLRNEHHLELAAVEYVVRNEIEYRSWRREGD